MKPLESLARIERRSLFVRLVAVLTAALWLVVIEQIIGLALGGSRRVITPLPALALIGGHGILQTAIIVTSAIAWLAARGWRKLRHREGLQPFVAGLAGCGLSAPVLAWVGFALASGDWIAEQSWAWVVRWGVLVAALPMGVFVWACFRVPAGDGGRKARVLTYGSALGSLGFAVADQTVMPGLYREFHVLVAALSAVFAHVAASRLAQIHLTSLPERRRRSLLWGGTAVLVAGIVTWFGMGPSTRAELMLRSPFAAKALRMTISTKPQRYLRDELAGLDVNAGAFGRAATGARGELVVGDDWNVLLIVVDTLRSDVIPPARSEGRFADVPTPFLDEWVLGSFHFRNAYAQANRTHHSMPALFRSLHPFEDASKLGMPLATYMEELGRTPVALVNNFFVEPRFKQAQLLLEGFHQVDVYEKRQMGQQPEQIRELLESVHDRPFFAWIHFYNVHHPGFDGKTLTAEDGPLSERYGRSVTWLDTQMGAIVEELGRLGIRDKTIIILASDHGEGLGDNGVKLHGPTVFEEELKVPLVIEVPGHEGREIVTTVGNIDIVPTIADLLGAPASPLHRGRSAVPLMMGHGRGEEARYYIENKDGKIVGLVEGRTKLVFDTEANVLMRFDLEQDPTEDINLYDPANPIDQQLLRSLLWRNPGLFSRELDDPRTRELIARRMAEIDPRAPGAGLGFILRLAALIEAEDLVEEGVRIFEGAEDDAVRLAVLDELLFLSRRRFEEVLVAELEARAGTAAELSLVEGLALQGHPPFAHVFASRRLTWWAERGGPPDWGPWLRLVRPWSGKSASRYGGPLASMLEQLADDPDADTDVIRLVLANLASLRGSSAKGSALTRLRTATPGFLAHSDALVRVEACGALASLRARSSIEALEDLARDEQEEIRVRQAALKALATLRGRHAIPLISDIGRDPLFAVDAIKLLTKIGHVDGLPYLRKTAKRHYNRLIRKRARKAIKEIEKRRRGRRE